MSNFSVPDDDEFAKKYILNHPENKIIFVRGNMGEPIQTVNRGDILVPFDGVVQLVFLPNGDVKGRKI